MKAWIVYRDFNGNRRACAWVIDAVVVLRYRDLVCHACADSFHCRHVGLIEKTFWGWASPFVDEIEIEYEAQVFEEEFQRLMESFRSPLAVSTAFIEIY